MSVNYQRNWQLVRYAAAAVGLLAANVVQAADFDCKLAATNIEKLICSDATVSQLDADLGVAYRNRRQWELHSMQSLGTTSYGTIDGYQQWLKGYKTVQRRWLKEVRNICASTECLTKAYRVRITELNGQQAPLPSFRLSKNYKPQLCTAMLEVLNRTPRELLGACTRHDYSGSPFAPVVTEASEELRIQYEKLDPYKGNPPFAERWPAIAGRYKSGHSKLIGQQTDVDGDGKPDWLLEFNYPSDICEVLTAGSSKEMMDQGRENRARWRTNSDAQQLAHAKEYGWISSVHLLKEDILQSLHGFGQLLRYQQQWVILQQASMDNKHSSNNLKDYISLRVMQTKPEASDGKWSAEENCSFWYNY